MRRIFGIVAAIAMVAALASVANAALGDYSSGEGLWSRSSNDRGEAGTRTNAEVTWEATGGVAATDGEFDLREQDGSGFHAQVVCLEVNGNEAILGLVADDGSFEGEAYAEDNNNGSGGDRNPDDLFTLQEDGEADCDDDDDGDDPIYGDIFNVDSGA